MTEQDIKALIEGQIQNAESSAKYYIQKADTLGRLLESIQSSELTETKVTRKPRREKTLNSSPQLRAELAKDIASIMTEKSVTKKDAIEVYVERTGSKLLSNTLATYLTPKVLGKKTYNKFFQGLVTKGPRPKAVNS